MNRKGMVATLDVLIFIVLLSVVTLTFVSFNTPELQETDVSTLCEDVFTTEIKSDDFLSNGDTTVYRLSDYVAMSITSGNEEFIETHVKSVLDDLLGKKYQYHLTMEYNNKIMEIGNGFESPSSVCKTEFDVIGPEDLYVELSLYDY